MVCYITITKLFWIKLKVFKSFFCHILLTTLDGTDVYKQQMMNH